MSEMHQVMGLARQYYQPEPYHNMPHAIHTTCCALNFARRALANGVDADMRVLTWGGLFHDAMYHDQLPMGFSSKEERSACIAMAEACLSGLSTPESWLVHEAIMGTDASIYPETPEARLLRAGDLAGLAYPYKQYKRDVECLQREAKSAGGLIHYWKRLGFLSNYLWPLIELTPYCYDSDGVSSWHRGSLSNLFTELTEMTCGQARLCFDTNLSDPLFRTTEQDCHLLLVGLTRDEQERGELTKRMQERHAVGGALELFLPGDASHLPIASGFDNFVSIR